MSEYMFGIHKGELTRDVHDTVDKICKDCGGDGVNGGNIPGLGWQYWFVGPNRGNPFDAQLRDYVLSAVNDAGIDW